jgi:hypothetical protein
MDAEKKDQLIAELVTTIIVLLFYWISTQPEWKLEMYVNKAMERFRLVRHTGPVVSLEHAETLRKFRQEISEWEHRNAAE